jgi:hypothetical protein
LPRTLDDIADPELRAFVERWGPIIADAGSLEKAYDRLTYAEQDAMMAELVRLMGRGALPGQDGQAGHSP